MDVKSQDQSVVEEQVPSSIQSTVCFDHYGKDKNLTTQMDVKSQNQSVVEEQESSRTSSKNTMDQKDKSKKGFVLKNWNVIGLWKWDVVVDDCAICRNRIMDLCIECQADQDLDATDKCTAAQGVCNHTYHLHCISNWLKTRNVCPLDNNLWEFEKCF